MQVAFPPSIHGGSGNVGVFGAVLTVDRGHGYVVKALSLSACMAMYYVAKGPELGFSCRGELWSFSLNRGHQS